jgi:hypothetical protein
MTATSAVPRRQVVYRELDDILGDARSLAAGPCVTVGKWTFAQNVVRARVNGRCDTPQGCENRELSHVAPLRFVPRDAARRVRHVPASRNLHARG